MKIRGTSASRMEQNYVEAIALMGDLKGVHAKAVIVAEALIDNLSMRLEWQAVENTRRGKQARSKNEPPPAPIATVAELECLGRIVTGLQDPRFGALSGEDLDAGAKEIVRILELARKEFGVNEQEIHKTTEGVEDVSEEAPEDKNDMDNAAGVKTRRNATPEGAVSKTTDGRRRLGIRGN